MVNNFGVDALISVCQDVYVKGISMLLKAGACVHPVKSKSKHIQNFALSSAAESGKLNTVELLLKAGANVKGRHAFNGCSSTQLYPACRKAGKSRS